MSKIPRPFKPKMWQSADTLEGRIYRAAVALDGMTDIFEFHLVDEMPEELRIAVLSCCEMLGTIRDEMYAISTTAFTLEAEGV